VIAQLAPGASSRFTFVRDGKEIDLPNTVGKRPRPGARPQE